MKRPAEVYQPSTRLYEGTPDQLDYGGMETRKVHPSRRDDLLSIGKDPAIGSLGRLECGPGRATRRNGRRVVRQSAAWPNRPADKLVPPLGSGPDGRGNRAFGRFRYAPSPECAELHLKSCPTRPERVTLTRKSVTHVLTQKCYLCSDCATRQAGNTRQRQQAAHSPRVRLPSFEPRASLEFPQRNIVGGGCLLFVDYCLFNASKLSVTTNKHSPGGGVRAAQIQSFGICPEHKHAYVSRAWAWTPAGRTP